MTYEEMEAIINSLYKAGHERYSEGYDLYLERDAYDEKEYEALQAEILLDRDKYNEAIEALRHIQRGLT